MQIQTILCSTFCFFLVSCYTSGGPRDSGEDLTDEVTVEDPGEIEEVFDIQDEGPDDGVDDETIMPPCTEAQDCTDGNPCNGLETCDPETLRCTVGPRPTDGTLCAFEPRSICLSGACVVSECGDGFVDTGALEFCEPPGEGHCHEDCGMFCDRYTVDCEDDGNFCNGEEYCYMELRECRRRNAPEPLTACSLDPRTICIENTCVGSFCGDGFVDTGGGEFCEPPDEGECNASCILSCSSDMDCQDDEDPCNGQEFCNPGAGLCDRRDPAPLGTVCNTSPRLICFGGACLESRCGDGYLDSEGGEYCEPPGLDDCGMDCQVHCSWDAECDDGEDCNGVEHCDNWMAVCMDQDPFPAGTPCDDGIPSNDPDICSSTNECTGIGDCEISGVSMISAGSAHTCALFDTGSIQCWGNNASGQLGNGTTEDAILPVPVSGLLGPAVTIAAGGASGYSMSVQSYSCAVIETGAIQCWGDNSHCQLGDGMCTHRLTPTPVLDLASGALAVAAGLWHTCALLDTGSIQCWGDNDQGQLGDGTTATSATPVTVVGLASNPGAVVVGHSHSCALLDGGEVQCWGANPSGQLGDGTTTSSAAPVTVTGLSSGAAAIAAGGSYTCALLDGGEVQCWGSNTYGQLGDGTTIDRPLPASVSGLSSNATAISIGFLHTCALLTAGEVQCWGSNFDGELGNGSVSYSMTPMTVDGLPENAASVSCGGGSYWYWFHSHTCSKLASGKVTCWGANHYSQLGDGTEESSAAPLPVRCW